MKAIVQDAYGSTETLRLRDVERPRTGDQEVLVAVRAAAVDPGVLIFMVGRPYLVRLAAGLRRPRVPVRGRDLAGVVTEVGARVTRFRPGDEVYGTSCAARTPSSPPPTRSGWPTSRPTCPSRRPPPCPSPG